MVFTIERFDCIGNIYTDSLSGSRLYYGIFVGSKSCKAIFLHNHQARSWILKINLAIWCKENSTCSINNYQDLWEMNHMPHSFTSIRYHIFLIGNSQQKVKKSKCEYRTFYIVPLAPFRWEKLHTYDWQWVLRDTVNVPKWRRDSNNIHIMSHLTQSVIDSFRRRINSTITRFKRAAREKGIATS